MNEILRNLDVENRFILATTCKTLWNYIIQYIHIKSTSSLDDYNHLRYVCDLELTNPKSIRNITDINNFHNLTYFSLYFENTNIENINFIANIGELKNLVSLTICITNSGCTNISPLIGLNKFEKLEILDLDFYENKITEIDFTNICKLEKLRILKIDLSINKIQNIDTLYSISLLHTLVELELKCQILRKA